MKCLECRKEMKMKHADHQYTECGLSNVVLKGIQVFHCAKCGEEEIVIPNIEELHRLVANLVARKRVPDTNGEHFSMMFINGSWRHSFHDDQRGMPMTQKMTWEEIRKQFPDKFVLLDHCVEQQIDDTHSEIVSGEVILVTSDGKEVFDEYKRRGKLSASSFAHTQWPKLEIVEIFAPGLRFMNLLG